MEVMGVTLHYFFNKEEKYDIRSYFDNNFLQELLKDFD
jgi:hypothetical protein